MTRGAGPVSTDSSSPRKSRMNLDRLPPLPPLPPFVLRPLFSQLLSSLLQRHPHLFERLGEYGDRRFLIDPSDLPFTLLLEPNADAPRLTPHLRSSEPAHHARIAGPIGRLVELVNGEADGDALFFSRDIRIEGDTEAVLALRNAVDDLEIDLVAEIDHLLGPLAAAARFARQRAHEATCLAQGLYSVWSQTLLGRAGDRRQHGGRS